MHHIGSVIRSLASRPPLAGHGVNATPLLCSRLLRSTRRIMCDHALVGDAHSAVLLVHRDAPYAIHRPPRQPITRRNHSHIPMYIGKDAGDSIHRKE